MRLQREEKEERQGRREMVERIFFVFENFETTSIPLQSMHSNFNAHYDSKKSVFLIYFKLS